jgi:hypothetical protein
MSNFTVYKPVKISKNKWALEHPKNSNSKIGFFKSRKAAMEYIIKTMSAILK